MNREELIEWAKKEFSTWVNLGDMNHRIHGGIFVKYDSILNTFELVNTRNMKEHFPDDEWEEYRKRGGKKYWFIENSIDPEDVFDSDVKELFGVDEVNTKENYVAILQVEALEGEKVRYFDNYREGLEEFGIPKNI